MMRRLSAYLFAAMAVLTIASCIHNDIPYPRIQANFINVEAKGQDGGAVIDSATRTVTLTFTEETDIYSVRITGYSITPGAQIVDSPFNDPVDLSSPLFVYLHLYQDWLWKIEGKQDIERYFEVASQMGETVIDVPGHRVVVYVRTGTDMTNIQVIRAKLAQIGSTMTPDIADGGTVDGSKPLKITTEAFGRTEEWTIYFETIDASVQTVSADAWTCVAWVNGQAEAGKDNGVEYRIAGSEIWTRVPAEDITHNGGSFTACIKHLSPQTQYETRAYSGEDVGDILDFTTGQALQLPNSDFDSWWLEKKVWNPWAENGTPYWGTGNPGAATVGQSNTVPTEDTPTGSGWAAKLETKYVVIKLAAGNIFTGTYLRTEGTNGVLSFGREFKERPTRLRGQYKYTSALIDKAAEGYKDMIGQPDTAIVWAALIDTPEPFEVRTNPANRQLFDPAGSYVVGYGKMECAQDVPNYIPFDFEIKYNSTSRVPTYIIVCASASKYGDYFTGAVGSTLYIDDFELIYDY